MVSSKNLSAERDFRDARGRGLTGVTVVLFGILLPIVTLVVEINSSLSADAFVDPIPTLAHILAVLSVPLFNLLGLIALYKQPGRLHKLIPYFLYFAIAISFIYSLVYLTLIPIALIGVLYFGIGLLPMAPLFSLIASIILLVSFYGNTPWVKVRHAYSGGLVALLLIVALEVPGMITSYGLSLYQSGDQQTSNQGLSILRNWGSESALLQNCYPRYKRIFDLASLAFNSGDGSINHEAARSAFYRVTGTAFNQHPRPVAKSSGRWSLFGGAVFSRTGADAEQGEQKVGGRVDKLWLRSSRFDGSVDAKSSLAYIEWTFEYQNHSATEAEARKEIQLPPDAVISRVTLWVNGKEREALVAKKGTAVAAYRTVVARRKDPILVTVSGKDRALVQMYPVPANGGVMKARIGFTVPLDLDLHGKARLAMPKINSRNFNISREFSHSLWIEANHTDNLYANDAKEKLPRKMVLREKVKHERFKQRRFFLETRQAQITPSIHTPLPVTVDKQEGKRSSVLSIVQSIVPSRSSKKRIHIVLDGSQGMEKYRKQILEVVRKLPSNIPLQFIVAGDSPRVLHPLKPVSQESTKKLLRRLNDFEFKGGANNIAALELATNKVSDEDTSALIWIHQPQPYLLESMTNLNQFWKRKKDNKLTVYYVPTENGENKIIQSMPKTVRARYASGFADLETGLLRLFDELSGKRVSMRRRYAVVQRAVVTPDSKTGSRHLVRLWANNEVHSLLRGGTKEQRERALQLSAVYRLVTPVSGAVVLETDRQYEQFGLRNTRGFLSSGKSNLFSVPTVPEPETWMLIIVSMSGFLAMLLRRKRDKQ